MAVSPEAEGRAVLVQAMCGRMGQHSCFVLLSLAGHQLFSEMANFPCQNGIHEHGRTARDFGLAATLWAGPKVFHHEQNFKWLSAGSAGILGKQFGDVGRPPQNPSLGFVALLKVYPLHAWPDGFLGLKWKRKIIVHSWIWFHVRVNGWIIISISKSPFISPVFFTPS